MNVCGLACIWQVMNLIGDVKGKVAVMVDDMIDTAGEVSLCSIICHLGQVYKRTNAWNASIMQPTDLLASVGKPKPGR